jgi:lysophospholipase L1-like esterase
MVWVAVVLLALGCVVCLWIGAWRLKLRPALAGVLLGAVAVVVALIYVSRAPEKLPLDPNPSSEFRIAALGDSYISGEGAPSYFPGTDDSPRNGCHRAASAHPYLVAKEMDASLSFVACSGARAKDVTGQDAAGKPVGGQYPASKGDLIGARPQVDMLRDLPEPDAVLLSIGGNDAGFAEIGRDCANPGPPDCRRSASFWLHRLDSDVYPALLRTYVAVRKAAPGAEVFVVTYPNPIGPTYCPDILLSRGEMGFIRDVFIKRLNELVKYAALVAQVRVIDLTDSLVGHRFCEQPLSKAAVNFVSLGRTHGSTIQLSFKGLGSLGHGTFHPNPLGHELLAKTVRPAVEAAKAGTLPPLPAPPPDGAGPPPFVPEELSPPVGTRPFPDGTPCRGTEIAFVSPLSVEPDITDIALSGVRPSSTVCYRPYRADWRSKRADATGAVRVPVNVSNAGVGGINEVLAEQTAGVWKKVVVSRLGAADEIDPPKAPSKAGLYIVLVVLGVSAGVALVLHWKSRRRVKDG